MEGLEPRILLYAASGNAWPHPEVVTISIVPDGTNLGGVTSNLNATFNSNPNLAGWQTEILRAAQVWAQQTNINFVLVTDSGASTGSGSYQQGSSTIGDIRIGGYAMSPSTLAQAYMPPPVNNFSIAGDVNFNTSVGFNIGSTYDLFTVATHEIGHALGLDHSTVSSSEMYATYNGVKSALTSDDISGVQSIYSGGAARSVDQYDAAASNDRSTTATDVTSLISASSLTGVVSGGDITTTADWDYYKVTAPAGTSSNMVVTVQSQGLSLLAPATTIYASDRTTVLRAGSALGQYGTTMTFTVNNVVAGATYYVKVRGADATAFGTGAYAVTFNFGTGASPTVTLPNTQTANGSPLTSGGGIADTAPESDDFGSGTDVFGSVAGNAAGGAATNPAPVIPGFVAGLPGGSVVLHDHSSTPKGPHFHGGHDSTTGAHQGDESDSGDDLSAVLDALLWDGDLNAG